MIQSNIVIGVYRTNAEEAPNPIVYRVIVDGEEVQVRGRLQTALLDLAEELDKKVGPFDV